MLTRATLRVMTPYRAEFNTTLAANYSLAAFAVTFIAGSLVLCALVQKEVFLRFREAQEELRVLRGLLPICMHCRNIQDDAGDWTQLEEYVTRHTEAEFSHGLCPSCLRDKYPDYA